MQNYKPNVYGPNGPWVLDQNGTAHAATNLDGYLRVENRPYGRLRYSIRSFTNPIYGNRMNVNGYNQSANTHLIYDGEQSTGWTISVVVGSPSDFVESTDQNHTVSGTTSFYTYPAEDGDTAQIALDTGTLLTDTYITFEFWAWIAQWNRGVSDIELFLWNTSTGEQVGNTVKMSDYFVQEQTLEWQRVSILMKDFYNGSLAFNAIRLRCVDDISDVYIDDVLFREPGDTNPIEFFLDRRIDPFTGQPEKLIVYGAQMSFASSTYDPIWDSNYPSPIPKLDYNKILDKTINNGVLYRRYAGGIPQYTDVWHDLKDFITLPNFNITNLVAHPDSGGFLTLGFTFAESTTILEPEDATSIIIQDDLTIFDHFTYIAECAVLIEDDTVL